MAEIPLTTYCQSHHETHGLCEEREGHEGPHKVYDRVTGGVQSTWTDERKKVADIPCLKCGGEDVALRFYDTGSYYDSAHAMCKKQVKLAPDRDYGGQFVEHFHRTCRRCHYSWPTDDVLVGE